MANRWFQQFQFSLEKQPVHLWFKVTFGANGAPTLVTANSKGIASIARSAEGKFLVTLQDTYYKLLGAQVVFDAGVTGPASPDLSLASVDVTTASAPTVTLLLQNGGTDTDPAEDEAGYFHLILSNSGAL